jgi:cobalt-zinc-cadmium efflux system protein
MISCKRVSELPCRGYVAREPKKGYHPTMTSEHHHHHHAHTHLHGMEGAQHAFFLGIMLNTGFVVVELVYGFLANSLALIADAGHNAGDVIGLLLAWGATRLATRRPSARYTYGLQSSTILAALANAMILLVACGSIGLEAVQRFMTPHPVASTTVMVVAGIGIVINGVTAWLFMKGRHDDVNMRGAYLHMATDALVSFGVVLAGVSMLVTGWLWLDAAISLAIACVIVWGTWGLLRESFDLALHAVPRHVNTQEVRTYLEDLPEVSNVDDLHIWAISTNETALTAHVTVRAGVAVRDDFVHHIAEALETRFRIGHSTIQIEKA